MYIIHHNGCTAKDMSEHFTKYSYGIGKNYTAKEISRIIQKYNNTGDNAYVWFNIKIVKKGSFNRYYIDNG